MSQQLISRSPDLTRLQQEGYEVETRNGFLLIRNVPYVNAARQIKRGTLISTLVLSGDVTTTPDTHVAYFAGEYPCDKDGNEISQIRHKSEGQTLADGVIADHSFSARPKAGGYPDYHAKMSTYAAILLGPAERLDSTATARTYAVVESTDDESVFRYIDTCTSRAGISTVSKKLELSKVGIVGLGGTGSYVLDLVAKTLVREIHLFDGDTFLQHNAFRTPGAASLDVLRARMKKVDYLRGMYDPMRRGIVGHPYHVDVTNVAELAAMDFVFVCIDKGNPKRIIVAALEEAGVSFVDVGMGVELIDDALIGILRVTTSTASKRDHVHEKHRIAFSDGDDDALYRNGIQIADLNALNAVLAVIKWKKLMGFYQDLENEHFSTFSINVNGLISEDQA